MEGEKRIFRTWRVKFFFSKKVMSGVMDVTPRLRKCIMHSNSEEIITAGYMAVRAALYSAIRSFSAPIFLFSPYENQFWLLENFCPHFRKTSECSTCVIVRRALGLSARTPMS
nr:hypothetical protein Iba_scaffold5942CG0250 [Ipomoea batatas]